MMTVLVGLVTLALPYSPMAGVLGFTSLSLSTLGLLLVIVLLYFAVAEWMKQWFYRHAKM
jgi:P-type Mg2+ transporter